MAVYEIQVVERSGAVAVRYSERAPRVGEELKIGARRHLVVARLLRPESPVASAAFRCERVPAERPLQR